MRDRPDEVYASRRAPAMRAESCNCNFQVRTGSWPKKEGIKLLESQLKSEKT